MEPVKTKITLLWRVYTTVVGIKEMNQVVEWKEDAVIGRSLGWFVHFEGSRESIHFGFEKPDIEVGDKFKITFEKVQDA